MTVPNVPARFSVVRELGRGGMATVYLAEDALTHSNVALKVLHPHLRGDELIAERFRREIAAARRVNHPNVAAIHDIIETDHALCLVVEFHEGVDLKRLLRRRGKLPVKDAEHIAGQILDGLDAAHEQGVVHRDVKPHNVLVDDELNVKLTDFGLARVDNLIGLTAHTMSLGTPEYMAPELFGSHYVDTRADVYAVGVTLFEMLTGQLPFRAGTPLALLDLHRSQRAPDVREHEPEVPEPLAKIVARALEKAPEDRFPTPAAMNRALNGEVQRERPDADVEVCRACDAPLPAGLNTCVECGADVVRICEEQQGRHFVYVARPHTGLTLRSDYLDVLTFEQKTLLIDELTLLGGEIQLVGYKLDRRLRTTPVMLGSKLGLVDAQRTCAALEAAGIPVRLGTPGLFGRLRVLLQFSINDAMIKTGLVVFLCLPLMVVVGRSSDSTAAAFLAGILPLLFALVAFAYSYLRSRKPLARFTGTRGTFRANSSLVDKAKVAFGQVRTPRIRQLLRRILQRGLELRKRLEATQAPPGVSEAVDQLLEVAVRGAARVGSLESENATIEPGVVLERMRTLDERIETSDDVHDVAEWLEEKARQRRLLQTFDANYDEITALTERLLEVSSELSNHLADLELLAADEVDLMSMSQVMLDLGAEVEAFVDVEESTPAVR